MNVGIENRDVRCPRKTRRVFHARLRTLAGPALALWRGMPRALRRSLPITGAAVLMTAALALAETPAGAAPHVRPESAEARALLDELTARSPTARALVDEVNHSTVVVYLRHRLFTSTVLTGRLGLVPSEGEMRYVVVEVASGQSRLDALITLGHELQHAVEVARAPAIVSGRTLAAHYGRIGLRTSGATEPLTFETQAALDMSSTVRRELLGSTVRATHDRNRPDRHEDPRGVS
jgi:hypothetical protein